MRVPNADDSSNSEYVSSALRRLWLFRQHGVDSRLRAFFLLARAANADRAGHLAVDDNRQGASLGKIIDPDRSLIAQRRDILFERFGRALPMGRGLRFQDRGFR